MTVPAYDDCVFVNCPFDDGHRELFEAMVFAIHDCGFVARSALEVEDGAEVRIEKIFRIIAECRFGIHDISRIQLDVGSGLPRFNMPFELGVFLGAKRFGPGRHKHKGCLIFADEPHRYQTYLSDIAGQDIRPHGRSPGQAIVAVRDALASRRAEIMPGGEEIVTRYARFRAHLPSFCADARLNPDHLRFFDYAKLVVKWLLAHQ